MMRGKGGVRIPPKNNDIVYEQPLLDFCHSAWSEICQKEKVRIVTNRVTSPPEASAQCHLQVSEGKRKDHIIHILVSEKIQLMYPCPGFIENGKLISSMDHNLIRKF